MTISSRRDFTARVIPGTRFTPELQQNRALLQHPVPTQLWEDLKAEGLLAANAPIGIPGSGGDLAG